MSVQLRSRFLDLQSLAGLEHMRFSTRQRIQGAYSGRHVSQQRGGAGEFVDYREYSDGEDLRRLDWKVLGRTGKAYIRLFQDETNLVCTMAIDASGSMRMGGRQHGEGSKLEYVQYLATALSHVISRGQDQVGLAVLDEGLRTYIAPGSMLSHVQHIQQQIERIHTSRSTRMAGSLQELFKRSSGRGVVVIMSDFLMDDVEEVFAGVRLFRHRQSEVIVLHVVHPDEERLPKGAAFRFTGLEGEGQVDCSPAEIRLHYEQRFADHLAAIRSMALSAGCDYRRMSTAVPYLQILNQFLVERTG